MFAYLCMSDWMRDSRDMTNYKVKYMWLLTKMYFIFCLYTQNFKINIFNVINKIYVQSFHILAGMAYQDCKVKTNDVKDNRLSKLLNNETEVCKVKKKIIY